MICQACGASNPEGDDKCAACGKSLSVESALKTSGKTSRRDTIAKLAMKTPLTSSPDASLGDVLRVLATNVLGAVVITDDNHRPIGIFSERDALLKLGPDYRDHLTTPISQFMTLKPQTINKDTSIAFAVHQMDVGHYRHLPVIDDDGRVKAVVSIRDLLRYLANRIAEVEQPE